MGCLLHYFDSRFRTLHSICEKIEISFFIINWQIYKHNIGI